MSKIKSIALIMFSDLKYHSVCLYICTGKREGGGCYIFFKMNNRIYLCLDLKKRNTNMLQNLDDWIMISNPYYNLK